VYVCIGYADEAAAIAGAVGVAAATKTVGSLTLYRRTPEAVERLSPDTWRVRCTYLPIDPVEDTSPTGEDVVDTTGGTQHITTSLAVASTFGTPMNACNGAIGYDGDSVQGCDVVRPMFQLDKRRYVADNAVNWVAWAALTGRVNDGNFLDFAAGEVLFLGVQGRRRMTGYTLWELTFRFSIIRNESNLSVGPFTNIAKNGWDYVDVQYAETLDDDSKRRVKAPIGGYVHQVYHTGNLSTLPL
jgi:hypothetical protein